MAESVAFVGDQLRNGTNGICDDSSINVAPSPSSGNSSNTLHDNGSSDNNRKCSNDSPFCATALNLEDLTIQDHSQAGVNHHTSPSHRNAKPQRGISTAYGYPTQHFRRNNYHVSFGNGYHGGGGRRHAPTWVSEETRAAQEFLVVRNSMKRLFKNADIAKWKMADYVAHREAMMASAAKTLAQQAQDKEDEATLRIPPISPQQQDTMRRCGLNGNFDQVGNYGRILGEKTIWCKDWQSGKDEIAPWPCMAELKWEGDDRAKTGVGRYPPLPREQGPPGLPWNQLQAIEQYPLDQIARIPTMEDVYLPVDEIDQEVKYDLLNKDLEDAMDAYLES